MAKTVKDNDIRDLYDFIESHPIALLLLDREELEALAESRAGLAEFTLTAPHADLKGIKTPCACIIFGSMVKSIGGKVRRMAYLGVMQSRSAVATLQSRVKLKRTAAIYPRSEEGLLALMGKSRFATDFESRINDAKRVSRLPPGLSREILFALESDGRNHWNLRSVMLGLQKPKPSSREAQQYDAVQTALKAFGLPNDAVATQLDVLKHSKSALGRARVMEDQVIEHDARNVPDFELTDSVTGRATFRNGKQTLEVFTANRTDLEQAFGVDLIYLNSFHNSAVMIQYKMLEPDSDDSESDWIYREDRHLSKQLHAMETFASKNNLKGSYRLCNDAFYFKFSRRLGNAPKSNMLLPLSHFREILDNPGMKNSVGKLKLSYKALDGKYLREATFFGLLQAGYIGSYAEKTKHLKTLIELVLQGNSSLVYALQRDTTPEEDASDRKQRLSAINREHQEFFNSAESDDF